MLGNGMPLGACTSLHSSTHPSTHLFTRQTLTEQLPCAQCGPVILTGQSLRDACVLWHPPPASSPLSKSFVEENSLFHHHVPNQEEKREFQF